MIRQAPPGIGPMMDMLCERGARFVLLADSVPAKRGFHTLRPRKEDLYVHYVESRGKPGLGIEPWSLGCAVIDVDGDEPGDGKKSTPEKRIETCKSIARWMGQRPAVVCYSRSGRESGKRHIWYKAADSDAPLGLNPNGEKRCNSGSNMYWDVPGSGTRFDIKCMRSYVEIPGTLYLRRLAWMVDSPQYVPAPKLAKLPERGLAWRPTTAALPLESAGPGGCSEARVQGLNRGWLGKRSMSEFPTKHEACLRFGRKAGRESVWNPGLKAECAEWLRANGVPEDRIAKDFESGYEYGLQNPVEPPPDRPFSPPPPRDADCPY